MPILIVGVNHESAPVALRERLAIPATALPPALAQLREQLGRGFLLATCNRTELITTADYQPETASRFLAELCGVPLAELRPHLRISADAAAVAHLFRVVAGLDSLIVGEDQIIAQFKAALDAATLSGTLDATLHRLGHAALAAGKRVRSETAIGQGNLSVVSMTLREASAQLGGLGERAILIAGAGDTGELVLKHLAKDHRNRPAQITVTNRTPERAEALAAQHGVAALPWSERGAALAAADLVIGCTASPVPIFDQWTVTEALSVRPGRPLLCYDLAVPRDFAPAVATIPGVTLRDVDALAASGAAARQQRSAAVSAAEAIVLTETDRFMIWWRGRTVAPAVSALRDHASAIRETEVTRALARMPELSAREEAVVRDLAASIVNKLLHRPVTTLKSAPEGATMARVVEDLFGLVTPPDDRLPVALPQERQLAVAD